MSSHAFLSFEELGRKYASLQKLGWSRHRRIRFIPQLTATDCGPACLAMALGYWSDDSSPDAVRRTIVSGRDGTSAQAIVEAARRLGADARAVSASLDELALLPRVSILHWRFRHFVVLEEWRTEGAWIVDPARGRLWIERSALSESYTGAAVTVQFDQVSKARRPREKRLTHQLRLLMVDRSFLAHIVVAAAATQALGLFPAVLTRQIVDHVVPSRDSAWLATLAAVAVLVALLQSWTASSRAVLMSYLRVRLDTRLTVGFLDHLMSLPYEFFQTRSSGDLLARVASNATVREILTGVVLSAWLDSALAIAYLVFLASIHPALAALVAFAVIVQTALYLVLRYRQKTLMALSLDAQAKSQSYLVETLSAVETLKAMGAEQRAVDRWTGLLTHELNASLARQVYEAKFDGALGLVRALSAFATLCAAAWLANRGTLSTGDVVASTSVAAGTMTPIMNMLSTGGRVVLLSAYLDRLYDVLDAAPEMKDDTTRVRHTVAGLVEAQAVSFAYSPQAPAVVSSVNLVVRPGQTVAIVGPSGAGKSTLARMLIGLYQPVGGRILVDGVDLSLVDLVALRRQIGFVTQHTQLFGGTIQSNVALGCPDAELEQIKWAASVACIDDVIHAMPMAYNTPLVDRGASLSGGEQQRLAIARAIVSRPKLLVLDEATSHLDTVTEAAVFRNLRAYNCTKIVVAHRLATVVDSDVIVVMNRGSVVESGSHDQLLSGGTLYPSLVKGQLVPQR